MEVQGKIIHIGKEETFGSNGFKKRECAVETEDQYPQKIGIEFVQDKCELLDKFKIGDAVTININLRGKEWTNPQGEVKYFNSLQGWKIIKNGASAPAADPAPASSEGNDNLPF